eukprot:jgi/Botrbrau1/1649/Bobra.0185s0059.1
MHISQTNTVKGLFCNETSIDLLCFLRVSAAAQMSFYLVNGIAPSPKLAPCQIWHMKRPYPTVAITSTTYSIYRAGWGVTVALFRVGNCTLPSRVRCTYRTPDTYHTLTQGTAEFTVRPVPIQYTFGTAPSLAAQFLAPRARKPEKFV